MTLAARGAEDTSVFERIVRNMVVKVKPVWNSNDLNIVFGISPRPIGRLFVTIVFILSALYDWTVLFVDPQARVRMYQITGSNIWGISGFIFALGG